MSNDAGRFRKQLASKVRQAKGLKPLSPEQADSALESAPEAPLSIDEIASIVHAATSGELTTWSPLPDLEWTEKEHTTNIENEVALLNRNAAAPDPETDELLNELRQEALRDDNGTEPDNHAEGGAASH